MSSRDRGRRRRDVVHADDRGALVERPHRRWRACRRRVVDREGRLAGRSARPADERLARRARRAAARRRASTSSRSRASSVEVVRRRSCRSRCRDRRTARAVAMPAARATSSRSTQEVADLADDVVVVRVVLHRARLALHVHRRRSRRRPRPRPREHLGVVAPGGDVVDDRSRRLRGRPPATSAFVVSMLTGTPASAARRSTTGQHPRRSRPRRRPARRPGRVDSPPTSRRSAPAATSARPWATAASGSRKRPPSEKESGVTFTTPMTAGRVSQTDPHSNTGGSVPVGADANGAIRGLSGRRGQPPAGASGPPAGRRWARPCPPSSRPRTPRSPRSGRPGSGRRAGGG